MHNNPWKVTGTKEIYDNPWISLTEFDVIKPSGGRGIYGKVHFKNRALGIVAMDNDQNIYLVGQFRFTLDGYSWEIPEGGGPLSEDPLDAAKRELKEETGIEADHWEKILDLHLSNSVTDEYGQVYLATGLHYKEAEPEDTEQLVVKKVSIDEAYRMVVKGEITDSIAVAGIMRTKLFIQEREKN
jgi:8-oxo-dGTP pyrophosphatase MutT (NUDIX family)